MPVRNLRRRGLFACSQGDDTVAWIKVENCTPDKPEIFHIADQLEIDPDAVLGKLIRLWIWADSQTYDGNASSVTRSLLDRVAGVTGFALAMENAGWLTPTDGGFVFPNFERHNGQTAKTRALTSKRVQKHRNASSVTSALPEKRREEGSIGGECTTNGSVESKTKTKSKRTTSGRSAYTPDFERFWSAFPAERKSKKADAWRAWKIHVNDDDVETVIAAAAEYAESDEARCKYVAGPAPWLNGERWQDDRKAWDRTVKDASDTAAQERAAEERREKHRAKQRLEQQRRVEEMEAAKRRNRSEAVPGFKLKGAD